MGLLRPRKIQLVQHCDVKIPQFALLATLLLLRHPFGQALIGRILPWHPAVPMIVKETFQRSVVAQPCRPWTGAGIKFKTDGPQGILPAFREFTTAEFIALVLHPQGEGIIRVSHRYTGMAVN